MNFWELSREIIKSKFINIYFNKQEDTYIYFQQIYKHKYIKIKKRTKERNEQIHKYMNEWKVWMTFSKINILKSFEKSLNEYIE